MHDLDRACGWNPRNLTRLSYGRRTRIPFPLHGLGRLRLTSSMPQLITPIDGATAQ